MMKHVLLAILLLGVNTGCGSNYSFAPSFWNRVEREAQAAETQAANSGIAADADPVAEDRDVVDDFATELRRAFREVRAGQSRRALWPAARTAADEMAADEVTEPSETGTPRGSLPGIVEQNPLVQKVVTANALAMRIPETAADEERTGHSPARAPDRIKIDNSDVRSVVPMIEKLIVGDAHGAFAADADNTDLGRRFRLYLITYANGKFVDRAGNELKKPEFKGGINNDAIQGLATVLFEALYDSNYEIPVWFAVENGKPVCLTPGNKVPTAVALELCPKRFVKDKPSTQPAETDQRITSAEVAAMQFFSQAGAEQLQMVSGLLLRALNEIDAGFVIVPGFAVGDNETFAKLVDTIVVVNTRRGIGAQAYRYFLKHDTHGDTMTEWLALIKKAYEIIYGLEQAAAADPNG